MRLIEVARALGMTGQKLRHELAEVDFGVKLTDREVSDQIAQGIIRYIANKYGIEVQMKKEEVSDMQEDESIDESEPELNSDEQKVDDKDQEQKENDKDSGKKKDKKKKLHVLRKLSLEDVSDASVRAHAARPQIFSKGGGNRRRRSSGDTRRTKKRRQNVQEQIKKKEGIVDLPDSITVKEFSEKVGVQVPEVISVLMKNGVMAAINQNIDFDTAAIVAEEIGVQVCKEQISVSAESLLAGNLAELLKEKDDSILFTRPPIVTVMGHVDHGKTAILDAIRKTNVASGEAGGITQSIGATQIIHEKKSVTFLDTPGHEAFTAMRARGAQITDIVILVIAADEGIKPTTVEAIAHAKEADVPILIALNKMDREGADPDRVKGELAQHDLQPEDWGGKIPIIQCSAKTGQGMNDLMDAVLVIAEMEELKADFDRPAVATVIESHLDSSLGPVASIIVNTGTLRIGENVVCGIASGRIKSMMDAHGERQEYVPPSGAVRISGISSVPETGDILQVVRSEQEARKVHQQIQEARERNRKRGLGDLITRLSEGKMHNLKIILKADSQGEIEALQSSLNKLKNKEGKMDIVPKVIHAAVGNISESDVMMAAASEGIVIGFNVALHSRVADIAQQNGIQIKLYDVIYELLDDVTSLLAGLVEPEEEEKILGHLEVRGHFFRKRNDQVIGGKVTDGILKRTPFRLLRDGEEIGKGRITNLKHVEKDVKEAKEEKEYGMRVECSADILEGDVLESYVQEFKKKS